MVKLKKEDGKFIKILPNGFWERKYLQVSQNMLN